MYFPIPSSPDMFNLKEPLSIYLPAECILQTEFISFYSAINSVSCAQDHSVAGDKEGLGSY